MNNKKIKKAKKEYNSSDWWFYEIFTNKSNLGYKFLRMHKSTYLLTAKEICVSENGKYGVICCFDLFFYNINSKKIIWHKKQFLTKRPEKILINTDKKQITTVYIDNILQEKVKLILDFNGNIISQPLTKRMLFKDIDNDLIIRKTPKVIYYSQQDIKNTKLFYRERFKLKGAPKPNKTNVFVESFAMEYYKKLGYHVQYYSQGIGSDIGHYTYNTQSYNALLDYFKFYKHRDEYFKKKYTTFRLLSKFIKIKNMEKFLTINRMDGKPDLLVYNDNKLFFVEVKSHLDKLRDNQKLFISGLELFKLAKVELLYIFPENLKGKPTQEVKWKLNQLI